MKIVCKIHFLSGHKSQPFSLFRHPSGLQDLGVIKRRKGGLRYGKSCLKGHI